MSVFVQDFCPTMPFFHQEALPPLLPLISLANMVYLLYVSKTLKYFVPLIVKLYSYQFSFPNCALHSSFAEETLPATTCTLVLKQEPKKVYHIHTCSTSPKYLASARGRARVDQLFTSDEHLALFTCRCARNLTGTVTFNLKLAHALSEQTQPYVVDYATGIVDTVYLYSH